MNCKQGDLAVIVSTTPADNWGFRDIGKIVIVEAPGDDWSDEGDPRPHWYCRIASGGLFHVANADGSNPGFSATGDIPDADLRPIRDPGDDAVDETLRETEHAL